MYGCKVGVGGGGGGGLLGTFCPVSGLNVPSLRYEDYGSLIQDVGSGCMPSAFKMKTISKYEHPLNTNWSCPTCKI